MKKYLYEKQDFVEDIPTIRELCGLSQAEFAELIGIHRTTLNDIERGSQPLTQTVYLAIMCVVKDYIERGNTKLDRFINSNW